MRGGNDRSARQDKSGTASQLWRYWINSPVSYRYSAVMLERDHPPSFLCFFFLFHGFDLVKITVESISCDFWQSLAEGATETSKYLSLFPGSAYKTRSN